MDPLPIASLAGIAALTCIRLGIQRLRTGDAGLRFSLRPFHLGVAANLWLLAHAIVGGAGALGYALGLAEPVFAALFTVPPAARVVGVCVSLAGSAATLACQLAMGASWRVGQDEAERTALVTRGPYRAVRNPIYSCVFVASAPLALLAPNALVLESIAAFVVGVEVLVRLVEEPHLTRVHGAAYATYTRDVGRFFPGLGRRR